MSQQDFNSVWQCNACKAVVFWYSEMDKHVCPKEQNKSVCVSETTNVLYRQLFQMTGNSSTRKVAIAKALQAERDRADAFEAELHTCPDCKMACKQCQCVEQKISKLTTALTKINDIRNSIIGFQTMNWSEHVYPLVAALNEAGFEGLGYPQAKARADTLLDERDALRAVLADSCCQCRFDKGKIIEECHYHQCARCMLLENGDPSELTWEQRAKDLAAELETERQKEAARREAMDLIAGIAKENRRERDVSRVALEGVAVMLNCVLKDYEKEPWAQAVRDVLQSTPPASGIREVSCVWCGHKFENTVQSQANHLYEHAKTCEKHPVRKLTEELKAEHERVGRMRSDVKAIAEKCDTLTAERDEWRGQSNEYGQNLKTLAQERDFDEEQAKKECDRERERADRLQKFKDYVHARLDSLGVPTDPDFAANKQHGCRVGGRFNWLSDQRDGLREVLESFPGHFSESAYNAWLSRRESMVRAGKPG